MGLSCFVETEGLEFKQYKDASFIMLCFIALCRYCIFYKLKFCSNPVPSTTLSAGFQTAFVHFMCHISLILAIFQTFVLLPYLLWRSVISVTITKGFQMIAFFTKEYF